MKTDDEHNLGCIVIAAAISAMVAQLVFIREYLALLGGNEFVIALILFNWLLLGALGAYSARNRAARPPYTVNRILILALLICALAIVELPLIRLLRQYLFVPGSDVGFYQTIAFTLFTMAPYGFLSGYFLPVTLFSIRRQQAGYPGASIYILNNIGDLIGGLFFSAALVFFCSPIQALVIGALPLLLCVGRVQIRRKNHVTGICLAMVVILCGISLFVEKTTLTTTPGELVFYQESRYGRITVMRNQDQFSLFTDGIPAMSSQTIADAEEAVHYPLSQRQHIDRVLLISAREGMIRQLGKHHPAHIDYVERDPQLPPVLFQFGLLDNADAVNVINQDARQYLEGTHQRYDAILVNFTTFQTFQSNRFFTEGFFKLARRKLTDHGVLAMSIDGYDAYVDDVMQRTLSVLYQTAAACFKHVLILPGQRTFFICSQLPLSDDIPARLNQKNIQTEYIEPYFDGIVSRQRIDALRRLLDSTALRNRDDRPVLVQLSFMQWFSRFHSSPVIFILVVGIIAGLYLKQIDAPRWILFTTGWTAMSVEILIIFLFQIYFGSIYFHIGALVTVFLAGFLPGALLGLRCNRLYKNQIIATDVMLISSMLIFGMVLIFEIHVPRTVFFITAFIFAAICGFQFPPALFYAGDGNRTAAGSISADLMGAALGVLVTSVIIIPYAGLQQAVLFLIAVKFSSLFVACRMPLSNHIAL